MDTQKKIVDTLQDPSTISYVRVADNMVRAGPALNVVAVDVHTYLSPGQMMGPGACFEEEKKKLGLIV
jgi:hypothetical protein